MKWNKVFLPLGLLTVYTTSLVAIEISNASQAIDIAGKQRMYTQRMLTDYAMVGMGNTFGKPDVDLKTITSSFEDHLIALKQYSKEAEIKKSLDEVTVLWQPLKNILSEKPSKDKVVQLQVDLEILLKKSNEATQLFAKASGKASAEIVNISGRQRMLSQRMASLYMLKVWGVEDTQFKRKLEDAMKLFKTSLETLNQSSLNTDEIKTLLSKVKRSFMFFEMMNKKATTKFVPTLIYKKSNDILKNMNSATEEYVVLETK